MISEEKIRKFDLNIEEVLENWEVYHALREIIANALDEQILTKTKDIKITKKSNILKIRDFGRGLKYEHLTQNENQEKLNSPESVIGKFGVGLKDAFATLNRQKIDVKIKTKHGNIILEKIKKNDFDDIFTLHAVISKPSEPDFVGTEFLLQGCSDEDLSKAKSLFLIFSGEKTLDKTKFGEILEKKSTISNIYINGVRVAEEEKFLFSYNITSMTSTMRKSLNRERTNVGRTAYADRIKSILLASKDPVVAKHLIDDLGKYEQGTQHDELDYDPVSIHACKILNSQTNVVFVTPEMLHNQNDLIDKAKKDGYDLMVIPETINKKIHGVKDFEGNVIRDLSQYQSEFNESFEFNFVSIEKLTDSERDVFNHIDKILELVGGKPKQVHEIKISETMRLDSSGFNVVGLWEPSENRIIIQRNQLSDFSLFAGTILHEIAHATSGYPDVSRDFEIKLTDFLGETATKSLNAK